MSRRLGESNKNQALVKGIFTMLILVSIVFALGSCGSGGKGTSPYDGREPSDVSAYPGMEGIEDTVFVDTTVREIERAVKNKQTFAFIATFVDCPYCNKVMPVLDQQAKKAGIKMGLLDTRKDPDWKSNLDIEDYDKFCELFGDYLEKDQNGELHLYTPDAFFIKDGAVVGRHKGVLGEDTDPEKELTDTQKEVLANLLDNEIKALR